MEKSSVPTKNSIRRESLLYDGPTRVPGGVEQAEESGQVVGDHRRPVYCRPLFVDLRESYSESGVPALESASQPAEFESGLVP